MLPPAAGEAPAWGREPPTSPVSPGPGSRRVAELGAEGTVPGCARSMGPLCRVRPGSRRWEPPWTPLQHHEGSPPASSPSRPPRHSQGCGGGLALEIFLGGGTTQQENAPGLSSLTPRLPAPPAVLPGELAGGQRARVRVPALGPGPIGDRSQPRDTGGRGGTRAHLPQHPAGPGTRRAGSTPASPMCPRGRRRQRHGARHPGVVPAASFWERRAGCLPSLLASFFFFLGGGKLRPGNVSQGRSEVSMAMGAGGPVSQAVQLPERPLNKRESSTLIGARPPGLAAQRLANAQLK